MAIQTPKTYRNQVLYSVFVRNYSQEGTFEAVRQDLDRIKSLGTDIIWLMPIHPIGEKARKGTWGSPYAAKDFRKITPDFGTEEDLKRLVDAAHEKGMKVIIDVVYNHTSPDSWLAENHPEWFFHKPDGSFGNRVGDWYDIIDLDYTQKGLWDYQIETLKMWAKIVDGFRCDAAVLVPMEFWQRAREEVETVRPGCIWLVESVEPHFIRLLRSKGMVGHSDGEALSVFDISYDYDIYWIYRKYLEGELELSAYTEALNWQEAIYPDNYVKLRFLENHDRPRAAQDIPDERMLRNWTAFLYFQKGMTMVYNGQEVSNAHRPQLFEKDPVDWQSGKDISDFLRKLYEIKQDPIFTDSAYEVKALPRDVIAATHTKGEQQLLGWFSVRGECTTVKTDLPDGVYENLLGGTVDIFEGSFGLTAEPVIIRK